MNRAKHFFLHFFWFAVMFAMLAAAMLPAFYLLRLLYRAVGEPGPFLSQALTLLVTTALFTLVFKLIGRWRYRAADRGQRMRERRMYGPGHLPKALVDTVEAVDRITQGDYNVLIEAEEHDRYYYMLTERINKMARNLRSMECMRQDFVSNVSHEMQSPLTSIAGFADLLRDPALPEEKRLHYLDIIESECKRLSRMSDNLMRLSMLDADNVSLDAQPFRLDRQIEDDLLLLEPQWAQKNLALDLEMDRVTMEGDMELLSQVWMNLLHNAIKFTPEDGQIHITLREDAEEGIVCTISDSGIGIPEENLMHVFERFYKVDKARDRQAGGSGLGLSIVRRIVELHRGTISVQSVEEEGTTFTVIFPANAA